MQNREFRIIKFEKANLRKSMAHVDWDPSGKVCDVVGIVIEAYISGSRLGAIVNIEVPGQESVLAEVVGFKDQKSLLLPYSNMSGISPGSRVTGKRVLDRIPAGDFMLGRVIDPLLNCLEGKALSIPTRVDMVPLESEAPNPMERGRIESPLSMGVRAIDGLLTFGEGQRVGIMAGSGVGKSVLMGMIAKGSDADVNVIGLIGERGREVREFLERDLGKTGLAKSVVVCVTSDQSPLMRIRGAKVTTAIAEAFSRRGKRVLLMMDSISRVALAQREIGLAVGEPPTTKGYPPSVFSLLPRLLERCGPQKQGRGSISGLYTVLVDGDDFNNPIPDTVRAILDGHINLSRSLASKNHFPAIDPTTSVSRVMRDVVSKLHWDLAGQMRAWLGVYEENFDFVQFGTYQAGTNPLLDQAIAVIPQINQFLQQGMEEGSNLNQSIEAIEQIVRSTEKNRLPGAATATG